MNADKASDSAASGQALHRRCAQGSHPLARAGPGRQMKEANMTIKRVALVLLCLMTGTAMAQEPKVTSLMSKDLPESPGKEVLVITVEHARRVDQYPPTRCTCVCLRPGGLRCGAAEGWATGNTDTRTDFL